MHILTVYASQHGADFFSFNSFKKVLEIYF